MDGLLPTFTRRNLSPPGFTEATWDKEVSKIADPSRVIIPLQDRSGASHEVTIKEGDEVLAGQKIGTSGNPPAFLSVHASISGAVEQISPMPHPLGFDALSVAIVSNGRDDHLDHIPLNQRGFAGNKQKMFEGFQEMGIPLNYQLFFSQGLRVPCLLVNATEFEPYLTSKYVMIREHAQDLIAGLCTLMEACSASQAVIIVEKSKSLLRITIMSIPPPIRVT